MGFHVEIFKDQTIKSVETIWKSFEEQGLVPAGLSFDYVNNWIKELKNSRSDNFGIKRETILLIGYNDQTPVCLFPLILVTRKKLGIFNIRSVEFITQALSFHNFDVIGNELSTREVSFMLKLIRKKYKPHYFYLQPFSASSLLFQAGRGRIFALSVRINIPLEDNYSHIRSNIYSRNFHRNLNSYANKLKDMVNPLQFQIISNKHEIEALKPDILKLTLLKEKQTGKPGHITNSDYGDFFFHSILNQPQPVLIIGRSSGLIVSSLIGYILNNVMYAIELAFDRNCAQNRNIGLGALMLDQLVQHFAGKIHALDLGPGLDDYKFGFSKQYEKSYCLIMPGKGILGKLIYRNIKRKCLKQQKWVSSRLTKHVIPKEMD
jgi:hypothetical protein